MGHYLMGDYLMGDYLMGDYSCYCPPLIRMFMNHFLYTHYCIYTGDPHGDNAIIMATR